MTPGRRSEYGRGLGRSRGWTVVVCLIVVLILVLEGYYGYAGVTFAVAFGGRINLPEPLRRVLRMPAPPYRCLSGAVARSGSRSARRSDAILGLEMDGRRRPAADGDQVLEFVRGPVGVLGDVLANWTGDRRTLAPALRVRSSWYPTTPRSRSLDRAADHLDLSRWQRVVPDGVMRQQCAPRSVTITHATAARRRIDPLAPVTRTSTSPTRTAAASAHGPAPRHRRAPATRAQPDISRSPGRRRYVRACDRDACDADTAGDKRRCCQVSRIRPRPRPPGSRSPRPPPESRPCRAAAVSRRPPPTRNGPDRDHADAECTASATIATGPQPRVRSATDHHRRSADARHPALGPEPPTRAPAPRGRGG